MSVFEVHRSRSAPTGTKPPPKREEMDAGMAVTLLLLMTSIVAIPTFLISAGMYLIGDPSESFFSYVGGRLLIAVGVAFALCVSLVLAVEMNSE